MSELTTAVQVSWDGSGDFDGAHDDVTARALNRSGITMAYGRDQSRSLSPTAPGRASLELDNTSRDYSPDNGSSPLTGQVLPARPIRVQATLGEDTYTLFRGHIDEFEVQPGRAERSVAVTALDPIAKLRETEISTGLYRGIRTGTAIGYVLDAVGWPTGDRDLDPGATVIRWWWAEREDAFEAIGRLVASEGPGAFLHADPDGQIVFRDRHHRLTRSASTTAQATWTGNSEPAYSDPVGYDHGWRDIINSVQLQVQELDQSADLEVVHDEADQVRNIAASSSITVRVETSDPVTDPEADYTTLAGSITPTLTQVSARTIDIELAAGGAAAAISGLRVLAHPVTVRRTYAASAQDTTSQDTYGLRAPQIEAPWAGVHDAQAIADLVVAQRADRLPILSLRMISGNVTRLTQQLSRDLSDRVHVVEDETGIDDDFFIEQIEHRLLAGGTILDTTFGLERAPASAAGDLFIFDETGAGFDDGAFGT